LWRIFFSEIRSPRKERYTLFLSPPQKKTCLSSEANIGLFVQNFNNGSMSQLRSIPIGLTSWCEKKVRVGTQESVTYYAHAVDLAFAITVWKCQGGTFNYIITLLEQTPGSPTLTFEKLYVMFTRVKKACKFWCLPLSPAFNKAKLYIT
jgi:hypothetical protein